MEKLNDRFSKALKQKAILGVITGNNLIDSVSNRLTLTIKNNIL